MKITTELLNIDNERKKDLINKANIIHDEIQLLYSNYIGAKHYPDIHAKIDKAICLYCKYYPYDRLNQSEKSFFVLYFLINNDQSFLRTCRNNKYNHKKIASFYSVTELASYLRYKNIILMRRYENDIKENNEEKKYTLSNDKSTNL